MPARNPRPACEWCGYVHRGKLTEAEHERHREGRAQRQREQDAAAVKRLVDATPPLPPEIMEKIRRIIQG
jgi:hypothetical protein